MTMIKSQKQLKKLIESLHREGDNALYDEWDYVCARTSYGSRATLLAIGLYIDDIVSYIKENINGFDFNTISTEVKVHLLLKDPDYFIKHIAINETFCKFQLTTLTSAYPEKFLKFFDFSKVNTEDFELFSICAPDIFEKLNTFPQTTNFSIWDNLFSNDFDKFSKLFLDHIHTVKSQSQLRKILKEYNQLLPLLRDDHLVHSSLSVKQWTLFLCRPAIVDGKFYINKSVCEYLDGANVIGKLGGKEYNSSQYRRAMRIINGKAQ